MAAINHAIWFIAAIFYFCCGLKGYFLNLVYIKQWLGVGVLDGCGGINIAYCSICLGGSFNLK